MNILDSLRLIYPYDPQTQTFTILTRLNSYADFFNPLDPSPAPTRDISPELIDYLTQCSDEIPTRYPLVISIEIRDETREAQQEAECMQSLQSFFHHEIFVTQAHIRHRRGMALKYLLVSLSCLAAYLLSEQWNPGFFLWNLLKEAVLIGGWVFAWEAVTLNFIEMDTHTLEIRKSRRIIEAMLNFSYKPDNSVLVR